MFPVGAFVRVEPAIQPTPVEIRFWRHVDKNGPVPAHAADLGPCWIWTGGCNSKGYGELKWSGERGRVLAHRASWEIAFGPVPEGMKVLHRCDNPPCVRPSHLFVGTQADNVRDMASKDRGAACPGEANPNAKLSGEDVERIRKDLAEGASASDLARRHGVTPTQIYAIKTGRSWSHV
jgi:hypothetical protein